MRFADAATGLLIKTEEWTMELRDGTRVIASVPVTFQPKDGGHVAEAVFGPFPSSRSWTEVVLRSRSGVEEPDVGNATLPRGKVYRHTVLLGTVG